MATMTKRILQSMGPASLGISLPIEWIRYNNLRPGSMVKVIEEYNIVHISLENNGEKKEKVEGGEERYESGRCKENL